MCQGCQAGVMLSRRSFGLSAVSAAALLLPWETRAKETKSPPKPQNVLSPDAALQRLIKGNERYIEGVSRSRRGIRCPSVAARAFDLRVYITRDSDLLVCPKR